MARYPKARWRPVARYQPGGAVNRRMATYRRYGLHTAVSSASSLYSYFSVAGRATSHFYIDAQGRVEQYIDTAYQSTAHLQGNKDTVTVETQDKGGPFPAWRNGSDVPAWTDAQVTALAELGAWLHATHGIPIRPCPDSTPGSRGFAYHRQGIDPWRVSGGEYWSKIRRKVCPGDRRVAQIPLIIIRATRMADPSTATPLPQDWWDTVNKDEAAKLITDVVRGQLRAVGLGVDGELAYSTMRRAINDTKVRNPLTKEWKPLPIVLWSIWYYSYHGALTDDLADAIVTRLGGSADAATVREAVRDVLGSLDEQ